METLQIELPQVMHGTRDQGILNDYCSNLQKILGSELESIILYGAATRSDYRPGTGEKNILAVVSNIDTNVLRRVMKPVLKGKKRGVQTLFMTRENLMSSTDVFPIRYQSMLESYVVLYGEDVLQRLDISRIHIRLICEQELRSLSLRLEKHFIDHSGKQLKEMMSSEITNFIETLRVAVLLKTREMSSWEEAIDKAIMAFKVEALILKQIIQLRNNEIKMGKSEIEALYNKFMIFVNQMVGIIDRMD